MKMGEDMHGGNRPQTYVLATCKLVSDLGRNSVGLSTGSTTVADRHGRRVRCAVLDELNLIQLTWMET